ncbi:MAG: ATP-dependent helicase, partial [Thermoplasmata archaeon]
LETLAKFIKRYKEELDSRRYTDFSHIQAQFLDFLNSKVGEIFIKGSSERNVTPLKYVLVDEYQDTNPIQETIYFTLAKLIHGNISVVGDDDQALYRFRGGTVECLVDFPNKCKNILGMEPVVVQLMTNYRSVSEITEFCEWLIDSVPEMKEPNARAPGKKKMNCKRGKGMGYTPVLKIMGRSKEDAAEKTAQTIKSIIDSNIVSNPAEIAVLFRSTRETKRYAGPLVEELRKINIPVYNPRSKSFLESEEIQCMLGALIRILDKDLEVARKLKGRVIQTIEKWCKKFDDLCKNYPKLKRYVDAVHKELQKKKPGEILSVGVCDIFYRLLSLEPFSVWQEDPNRTFRLGQLSSILEAYTTIEGIDYLRVGKNPGSFSSEMLYFGFYLRFIQFLHNQALDDPENVDYEIVPGYVQVMTVHQAKGLEFPIVFVDSLDSIFHPEEAAYILEDLLVPFSKNQRTMNSSMNRATQDLVRFYYVAFSRAKNLLFLFGSKEQFDSFMMQSGGSL